MLRRFVIVVSACAALLGLSGVFAGSANAAITHIHTVDADLARVCVIQASSNRGVCVHV